MHEHHKSCTVCSVDRDEIFVAGQGLYVERSLSSMCMLTVTLFASEYTNVVNILF